MKLRVHTRTPAKIIEITQYFTKVSLAFALQLLSGMKRNVKHFFSAQPHHALSSALFAMLLTASQGCAVAMMDGSDVEVSEATVEGDAAQARDARRRDRDGTADDAPAEDVMTDANTTDAMTVSDASIATDAAQTDVPAPMLGRVLPSMTACRGGANAGPLPNTTCTMYRVECPGVEAVDVALRVTPAPSGTSSRGVLVFGSGSLGTGFYSGTTEADAMYSRLNRAGFTVIERAWSANTGWIGNTAGAGMVASACRYATLLRFIDTTYRTGTQPLCATGNSGGSAELGYVVLRQGAGDVLDLAVPTSGPFHQLDLACAGDSDAAWMNTCMQLKQRHCPNCMNRSCALGGARRLVDTAYGMQTPCTGSTTPVDRALLRPDSPALEGRIPSLPNTRVVLLIGEQDEGGFAPMSAALYEALRGAGVDAAFETEPGAGHEFANYAAGAMHLERVLLRDCRRRH